MFAILFATSAVFMMQYNKFMMQYNKWRNERSMHRRLDIRWAEKMNEHPKFIERNAKPAILQCLITMPPYMLDKSRVTDEERSKFLRHKFSEFLEEEMINFVSITEKNVSVPMHEQAYISEPISKRFIMKIAVMPKEYVQHQ
jgi:hypothetical protein